MMRSVLTHGLLVSVTAQESFGHAELTFRHDRSGQ
jgi:hypothetical protein